MNFQFIEPFNLISTVRTRQFSQTWAYQRRGETNVFFKMTFFVQRLPQNEALGVRFSKKLSRGPSRS